MYDKIVDEPYLGYQVHLNKLSAGWRPLFQKHKTIKTFKELEEFMMNMAGSIPGSSILTECTGTVSVSWKYLSGFMK
ncbi:hypothetical protein [Eubacterium uniforme]|uniref:hypothetical protein n=1 Tax=Eubacterium uniforme TaxID=39495 RepID=UPI00135668FD|nr:hypothetical protein [Eubacterium uniforme]